MPTKTKPDPNLMPEAAAWCNFLESTDDETREYWSRVATAMRDHLKSQHPDIPVSEAAVGGAIMALVAKGITGKFKRMQPPMKIVIVPEPKPVVYPVGVEG